MGVRPVVRWLAAVGAVTAGGLLFDAGPDAERRFTDERAGVSYVIPSGWSGPETEGLVGFFTSTATPRAQGSGPTALIAAGLFASTFYDPSREGLREAAMATARGMAEFFFPTQGEVAVLADAPHSVGEHDGRRVRLRITFEDDAVPPATVQLVAVAASPPAYLVGVVTADDHALQAAVARSLDSVRCCGAARTRSSRTAPARTPR